MDTRSLNTESIDWLTEIIAGKTRSTTIGGDKSPIWQLENGRPGVGRQRAANHIVYIEKEEKKILMLAPFNTSPLWALDGGGEQNRR